MALLRKTMVTLNRIDGFGRKTPGQTVIAHLSDLHFDTSTRTDGPVWAALTADLTEAAGKIDVLAVTGDLIDGSVTDAFRMDKAFRNVHDYLLSLCLSANVERRGLFVVPGNHDVKLQGIIGFRSTQADTFRSVFGAHGEHAYFPELHAFIFPFDSNVNLSPIELAAGSVAETDLTFFKSVVGEAEKIPEWNRCTRVALLHHHPMPIAATEHRSVHNLEEYLLLRNAGMFMEEMVRRSMDVILHGHKHHPAASRAVFFDGEGEARAISVVASGSAGRSEKRPVCYNLITLHDNGSIDLERRARPTANYEREMVARLVSYADARRVRFHRLASSSKQQLRVTSLKRVDTILAPGGDDLISETFENAVSVRGAPVHQLSVAYQSSLAYFAECTLQPSSITWEWTKADGDDRQTRRGVASFDPPISTQPFTFQRNIRLANAIFFRKRDRLDATDQESDEETIGGIAECICERLHLATVFPPGRFPDSVRLVVRDPEGSRDLAEEDYCRRFLINIESARTVVLSVDLPLPGYEYALIWKVPDEDGGEPVLSAADAGKVEEIGRRLWRWRQEPAAQLRVVTSLLNVGESVLEEIFGQAPPDPAGGLEVSLFLYDSEQHGLLCAHTTIANPADPILTTLIRPGRQPVGQAFLRSEPVLYIASESPLFVEEAARTAVWAQPVYYPAPGRRVGVLSLASTSNLTPLLRLSNDSTLQELITLKVRLWWSEFLAAELGIHG